MDKYRGKCKKTRRTSWLVIAMVVSFCVFSSNANLFASSSDTANLGVSATISAKCKFMGTSAQVSFGQYNVISENEFTPATSSSDVSAKCTRNTTSQIAMSNGMHAAQATSTTRAMSDGNGNYLSYEIYSDPGRATVWSESNTVSYTQTGSSTPVPIYAAIPPDQDVVAGEYSDTVTMTVSY